MRHLLDSTAASELKARLQQLRADNARRWGTMNPAQAVAHCAGGLELALGDIKAARMVIGRIIGWAVKPLALGNDAPMRRNSPTVPEIVVGDARDQDVERERLVALIDRATTAGPAGWTSHPHSFFGRLQPQEWSVLMYKHLDHHLRQFGV